VPNLGFEPRTGRLLAREARVGRQNSAGCQAAAERGCGAGARLASAGPLIPHLGGKNSRSGSAEGAKRALMRVRALASSGAASRQYLSVSQNRSEEHTS